MAKIIVVGTSNSVVGRKGFIKSLSIEHEVINLSSGRVPFYCHIKTIEKNKNLIESSDLLIVDHYINDLGFYAQKLGDTYFYRECEYFYQLLSSINTNIINLLFPLQNLSRILTKKPYLDFYKRIKELTKKYNLSIVDLNDYNFKPHHYHNSKHIKPEVSYAVGLSLSKIINIFQGDKPDGGKLINNPFKIFDASFLIDFIPNSEIKTFTNSIMETNYVDIKNKLTIDNLHGMSLKSIGYLIPKEMQNRNSGLIINDRYTYGLTPAGYYHESLDREIAIDSSLTLAPMEGFYSDVSSLMQRTRISGIFDFLYITEIVLFTGAKMVYRSAKRHEKLVFLKDLEYMLDSMFIDVDNTLIKLSPITINALRDAAVLLEKTDLEKSHELMTLAHQGRPKAQLIKKKLAQYRKRLNTSILQKD